MRKPDRVLLITERRGRRWTSNRAPYLTGMGGLSALGHKLLYKVNVYFKELSA